MSVPTELILAPGRAARAIRVERQDDLVDAAAALGLAGAGAALVVVGGASEMTDGEAAALEPLFRDVIAPLADAHRAVVVDGGTDAGVMALAGQARAETGARFPLVGVIVERLADEAGLEPNHTHIIFVPGSTWGDEAPWLARLADVVSGGRSVTVLANGGPIAWEDARHSVESGRAVVALAGSGRTADEVAAGEDSRAEELGASGLVHSVAVDEPAKLAELLERLLEGR